MAQPEDKHFQLFAKVLEDTIFGYGVTDEDLTARQKRQVETLTSLECEFRQALIRDPKGPGAYAAFVTHVMDVQKGLLSARPFFRERQDVFKEFISPMLRNREHVGLYRFNINFLFVKLMLKLVDFDETSEVRALAKRISDVREELISMNMPLAISRARIFKRCTPKSHLTYMDLIQLSAEGLIAAVDKFVLPYTPVFRAVIIGRITGNLIEDYSKTMLHFVPSDRRKLYKAHKARGRRPDQTPQEISDRVNGNSYSRDFTTESEVHLLMSAVSYVSIDAPIPGDFETSDTGEGGDNGIERYEASPDTRPDVMVEKQNLHVALHDAIQRLPLIEQKLLTLKGISL